MQFKGQAGPGDKEGTMVAKTTSDSCRITSTVQDTGLAAALEKVAGGEAGFEPVVTLTGESSFLESGSIHFGGGHSRRFSTMGQGYLGASADRGSKHRTTNRRLASAG